MGKHDEGHEVKPKVHRTHDAHAGQQEENINIRAAVVHVIGDIIQSIGVIIAATLILFVPAAKIADPICTYLFSILVIFTTVPVFRDCIAVLMESVPTSIDL
jgi:zinc transporter 2